MRDLPAPARDRSAPFEAVEGRRILVRGHIGGDTGVIFGGREANLRHAIRARCPSTTASVRPHWNSRASRFSFGAMRDRLG